MDAQKDPLVSASALEVLKSFVHLYHTILHQHPHMLNKFYWDESVLSCPDADGDMTSITTLERINEMIRCLDYQNYKIEIETADAQESYNGGVIVLVTGFIIGTDNLTRSFMHTFFLASQPTGYFVHNDLFRYVDYIKPDSKAGKVSGNNDAPGHRPPDLGSETTTSTVQQDVPKKSYSSILGSQTKKESMKPMLANSSKFAATKSESPLFDSAAKTSSHASEASLLATSGITGPGSKGAHHEVEGYSIHVANLPPRVTIDEVETELKKFETIKPNGVLVKTRKGRWFGFVEFQDLRSMESALQASSIMIGGRQAAAVKTRSTNRFSYRRGQISCQGPFQNENFRGGGNCVDGHLFKGSDIDSPNNFSGRGMP